MTTFIREKAFHAVDKHGRIQPAVVNLDHLKSPKAVPPALVVETGVEPGEEDET